MIFSWNFAREKWLLRFHKTVRYLWIRESEEEEVNSHTRQQNRSAGVKVRERFADQPLKMLSPSQVKQIDHALYCLRDSGEIGLLKNKGRLRFITVVRDEERI